MAPVAVSSLRSSPVAFVHANHLFRKLESSPSPTATSATPVGAPQPVVRGNALVDARTGAWLRLGGVNRSGTEYACVQGWGIFDGPSSAASISAMAAWHVNTVRVPINEDCWLGINGVDPAYSGATYRQAIAGYVSELNAAGIAAIVDLHWGAPGSALATGQEQMPDASHAVTFWTSVAEYFHTNPSVMFEAFNEPHGVTWTCWRWGCQTPAGYTAVGMQQLVNAIRATGARQPIILDGLNWGGDLSGWQANEPSDPLHQLVAGWHIYNYSGCNTAACWDATAAPLATAVPVLLTEVGQNDCGTGFLDSFLSWAIDHGIGFLGWAWDTWPGCTGPSLITNYSGSPTVEGSAIQQALSVWAGTGTVAAAPTPTASAQPANGSADAFTAAWEAVSTAVATSPTGGSALAVTLDQPGYPAVGTRSGLSGVTTGAQLSFTVWVPNGADLSASPALLDADWAPHVLPAVNLVPGWNTVKALVPAMPDPPQLLGLQINDGSGWTGTLYLGSAAW